MAASVERMACPPSRMALSSASVPHAGAARCRAPALPCHSSMSCHVCVCGSSRAVSKSGTDVLPWRCSRRSRVQCRGQGAAPVPRCTLCAIAPAYASPGSPVVVTYRVLSYCVVAMWEWCRRLTRETALRARHCVMADLYQTPRPRRPPLPAAAPRVFRSRLQVRRRGLRSSCAVATPM